MKPFVGTRMVSGLRAPARTVGILNTGSDLPFPASRARNNRFPTQHCSRPLNLGSSSHYSVGRARPRGVENSYTSLRQCETRVGRDLPPAPNPLNHGDNHFRWHGACFDWCGAKRRATRAIGTLEK